MRYCLVCLFLFSCKANSQNGFYGDWYNIGTERLIHFKIDKNNFSSDEKTFLFAEKDGKRSRQAITHAFYINELVCLLREDSAENLPRFEMMVFRHNKEFNSLDMLLECSDEFASDTSAIKEYVRTCATSSKMIMRFYPKETILQFSKLKAVNKATAAELKSLNQKLQEQVERITKEIGEDKLLWIAPVIFQQALTEILVNAGYSPLLTETQATELFDFHYF